MKKTFTPMSERDSILMGFHYMDGSNMEHIRDPINYPINIYPYFEDYLVYMENDMLQSNYADFWRWWYVLERYKGDELGLKELDDIVEDCLKRSIKVKIDPAWNTWWSLDVDWEFHDNMSLGPQDMDDWIHFCDLVARRYRGRICLWDLQGEANGKEVYWLDKDTKYINEVYINGYKALKAVDKKVRVGASGASPSVPLKEMDDWYWSNIEPCAGYYDNIPMNFFAHLADPYEGGLNYYRSIQNMLDKVGQSDVEIGMGETSVQWAESTVLAATDDLNMGIQTRSVNELYGSLFNEGMNKNIMWFTQYAPGGGHWPWCWGLRNYEDWWGIFPEDKKIPGTRIVYRYDDPDGKIYDMRPEWPEPENPYFPAWEIHKFWQQCAPNGQESVRIQMDCSSSAAWKLCSWQKTADTLVGLIYIPESETISVSMYADKAGWENNDAVMCIATSKRFDMDKGKWFDVKEQEMSLTITEGKISLSLPETDGFISLKVKRDNPVKQSEFLNIILPSTAETDTKITGYAVVKNTGSKAWTSSDVSLRVDETTYALKQNVSPGDVVTIPFDVNAEDMPGLQSVVLRMLFKGCPFGPEAYGHIDLVNTTAPRKLVAFTGGQPMVQWFSPTGSETPKSYLLYRAEGFDSSFDFIRETEALCYIDKDVNPDTAYYYKVKAKYADGSESGFSNTDNAKKRTSQRYYDAEIVGFEAPNLLAMGKTGEIKIKFRNTGTKDWQLNKNIVKFSLLCTRYFDETDYKKLPSYTAVSEGDIIKPGEEVSFCFPISAPYPGVYENHWVLCFEVKIDPEKWRGAETRQVFVGTPLLHEVTVTSQ